MEILVIFRLFSKIEILPVRFRFFVINGNFSRILIFVKNGFFVKSANFGQTWKFWSKAEKLAEI